MIMGAGISSAISSMMQELQILGVKISIFIKIQKHSWIKFIGHYHNMIIISNVVYVCDSFCLLVLWFISNSVFAAIVIMVSSKISILDCI